jgi:hypothetical protein
MVITEVEDRPSVWVCFYTSSAYIKSKNISDALAGNGPIVVSKLTGRFVAAGSAAPIENRIQEAILALKL